MGGRSGVAGGQRSRAQRHADRAVDEIQPWVADAWIDAAKTKVANASTHLTGQQILDAHNYGTLTLAWPGA